MNGRERVQAAIAQQAPDRVPLGLYAIDCDTAGRILGRDTFIRNKPGIQLALWQGRRDEVAESLKLDVVDLFKKLDVVDLIICKEAQLLPPRGHAAEMPRKIGEDLYEDRQGRVWQLSFLSNDIAVVNAESATELPEYTPDMFPLPDPVDIPLPDASQYEVFDHMVEQLGEERYVASCNGGLSCMPLLGGMEQGLMQYALAPEAVAAAARRNTRVAGVVDTVALRPGCAGAMIEQDMAGTNGLLISPTQWREICKPCLAERVTSLKRRVGQVILHCCGRATEIMDDIIDCGVDCYQSLQTSAGMSPADLCPTFGERIALWGGAPVELLISGTADEMRAAVRTTMEATRDSPGFILGPSHSIAFGTKYDNFMAMLDEFHKHADR